MLRNWERKSRDLKGLSPTPNTTRGQGRGFGESLNLQILVLGWIASKNNETPPGKTWHLLDEEGHKPGWPWVKGRMRNGEICIPCHHEIVQGWQIRWLTVFKAYFNFVLIFSSRKESCFHGMVSCWGQTWFFLILATPEFEFRPHTC
jgi:hypothetical protein